MPLEVRDPYRRLPADAKGALSGLRGGLLVVPEGKAPIHPASLRALAAAAERGGPVACTPKIPVTSTLGLPKYDPVLHWLPGENGSTRSRWQRIGDRLTGSRPPQQHASELDLSRCEDVDLLSEEEQIHYYADHFPAICPHPIQVSVVVSNVCNLRCVMCPYHSPKIRPTHRTPFFDEKNWMDWELMDRIASECGESATPVKMGNIEEPLLHPKILDFVRECRDRGVPSVHITTNGTALTEELGRRLLDVGLTSLYVSLDAARPETYRQIRNADLDRAEANTRAFIEARNGGGFPCRVMTSLVRNREIPEQEEQEFLSNWLPEVDGVILYNLAEYEKGNSKFTLINEVAKERLREVGRRWACLNPWQEVYLLPDGRVYYCCETVSKLAFEELESMGEYPRESLSQIWCGEAFRSLRRDLIVNKLDRWPACASCGIWMAHVCQTHQENGVRKTRNMITEIIEKLD